ncbi:MAG TPA: immunity 49 family protein, partial [Steroidobacteraceae bacterium]
DGPQEMAQLHRIGQRGLEVMQEASVFAREHPLLPTAARTLAQAQLGAVRHALTPRGAPVEFPLGGRWVSMQSAGTNGQSDVGAWIQGWYGALIARDPDVQTGLRGVPDELLEAGAHYDTYHYAWKKALLALDIDPALTMAEVEQAVRLTDASFITEAKPGVPATAAAMFPMLAAIARADAAAFTDALVRALEAHRAYWGNEAPHGPISWLALGPLALCCLARDRGLPLEVESDYLVPVLISRSA